MLTVSSFRGVTWSKRHLRWQAGISLQGRYLYVGIFDDEQEAAKAWDLVALKSRGISTATNFPVGSYLDTDGAIVPHAKYDKLLSNRKAKRALGEAAPSLPCSCSCKQKGGKKDWDCQRPIKRSTSPAAAAAAAAATTAGCLCEDAGRGFGGTFAASSTTSGSTASVARMPAAAAAAEADVAGGGSAAGSAAAQSAAGPAASPEGWAAFGSARCTVGESAVPLSPFFAAAQQPAAALFCTQMSSSSCKPAAAGAAGSTHLPAQPQLQQQQQQQVLPAPPVVLLDAAAVDAWLPLPSLENEDLFAVTDQLLEELLVLPSMQPCLQQQQQQQQMLGCSAAPVPGMLDLLMQP
uniref:AP2/ERF domain-containing protein n=1 Tax=Tetradesmus obliquus TaxID=3088 RepID=A0A383WC81_TETOB